MKPTARQIFLRYGITYRKLREFLYAQNHPHSKTTISDMINHGKWPKRDQMVRENVMLFLAQHGVPKPVLNSLFQEPAVNDAPDKILRRKTMITPEIQKAIGLSKDPFDNELEGIEDVMPTTPSKKVLAKMMDAARNGKFIAICGPVGSGKSVAKTVFKEELKNKQNYLICEPEIIDKEKCIPSNIINAMIDDFLYGAARTRNLKSVSIGKGDLEVKSRWVHALLRMKVNEGKKLVLIIDEAHGLRPETLRVLKRFHELQDGFKKLLCIILVGQEELVERLTGNYDLREVSARINLVEMRAIPNDIADYLEHKFLRAGGKLNGILDDSALKAVKRLLPKAIPLSINNLTSKAIEDAYNAGSFPVNAELVESAYRSIKNIAA